MSASLWPLDIHPWDFPGKNTGVGCHFLLQCMKVKSESEVALSCPTLRDPMDCSLPGSSVHGVFQATVLEWGSIAFSLPSPQACSNSCPLSRWCYSTTSSSVIPFSCLQSLPASRSFPMSQFFARGGQSIGVSVSASVLPMNIQDSFHLGWTGWISL